MSAYKNIVMLTKKVLELERQIEYLKKCNWQEIEKYKAWNEQDVKFIAKLNKEIKELKTQK